MDTLKSEFRKIFTTRSTLLMLLIAFLLSVGLIGFWIYGYKNVSHAAENSGVLLDCLFAAVSTIGVFMSFVTILLVGHEYRYNTIMYSLTSSNSRSKVFFAKYAAAVLFALATTAALLLCTALALFIGFKVSGVIFMDQHVDWGMFLWRAAASIIGSVSFAFIATMLIRSLTGSIALVIVLPSFGEGLLTLLLHDNVKYLPYTALSNFTQLNGPSATLSLTVVCTYVAVLGMVAYSFFLRRDAN